ncbi:MAG TPA: VOC family protein [Niabella sp.]
MQPPVIETLQVQPTLQVSNIPEAIDFYTQKLGFTPGFTWGAEPRFAGISLGDKQVFLSLTGEPHTGSTVSFVVEDADELFTFHQANKITITEPIADREYGIRDYAILDPYGNRLVFGHYIYNNIEPPIEIERVDVPVRLEKRLAALLEDLAAHKKMPVNSCLEEILLHSFEPYGDSVASPHTKGTLRYIKELKEKHGIDYDTHGSYRFIEKI